MRTRSPLLGALLLLLPLLANATPLLTTTFEVDGTPVVILEEVVATVTVTVHDGGATGTAAPAVVTGINSGTDTGSGSASGSHGHGSGHTTVVNAGGNTIVTGPYGTSTGPVPSPTVLAPAIHPHVNPADIINIHLVNNVNLFYADPAPASADVSVAFVNIPRTHYPAVVFDHSSLIHSLVCKESSMSVRFTTDVAFHAAQANWTVESSSFVAITSSDGCASTAGQHDYILVNNVVFTASNLSATLSTTYINMTQAVGADNPVTVDLGNFTLSTGNASTGFSTGAPGGTANGTTNGTATSPDGASYTSVSSTSAADFDVALDQSIGYLDVDDDTYWSQLYPGVTGETFSDFAGEDTGPALEADPEKRRRSTNVPAHVYKLSRRGWFDSVVNTFKAATTAVVNTAKAVASTVATVAVAAKDKVVETAAQAYDTLNPFTPRTFTPVTKDLAFSTPQGTASTPWGAGQQLYTKTQNGGAIAIYCVGCGAQGTLSVKGTLTFIVGSFSLSGSLNAAGALHAALELGIVASYANTWAYNKEIANIPLSPLSVPGILTIGPQVVLSAGGSLTVNAVGQLLAGAVVDWPAINVNIDLLSPSSSTASGFTPKLNPVFQVSGAVSATADAYLTVSVGFGIDILAGTISKQVALVEKPDITITAATAGSASLSGGSVVGTIGTAACAGVSLNVNFNNYVYADLAGTAKSISTLTLPVLNKCIAISKKRRSLDARTIEHAEHVPHDRRAITENLFNMTAPVINYTVLNAADGGLEVHWADNGNLYAIGTNTTTASGIDDSILFSVSGSGAVVGDSAGRLLHGHVDTLAALGVSRLRLSDGDSIPVTSVMLTLAPVDAGTGPSVMMAFDTAGNAYYPILCVYGDLYPKLFIAKDPDAGALVLQDSANVGSLTGGSVKECGFFGITDGAKGENDS